MREEQGDLPQWGCLHGGEEPNGQGVWTPVAKRGGPRVVKGLWGPPWWSRGGVGPPVVMGV